MPLRCHGPPRGAGRRGREGAIASLEEGSLLAAGRRHWSELSPVASAAAEGTCRAGSQRQAAATGTEAKCLGIEQVMVSLDRR
jgi:hypothetical protein